MERYVRIEVTRDGSGEVGLAVQGAPDLFFESGAPPVGPASGSHAVIARGRDGGVVGASLVAFPTRIHAHGVDGPSEHPYPRNRAATVTLFAKASDEVDRYELVDPSRRVISTARLAEPRPAFVPGPWLARAASFEEEPPPPTPTRATPCALAPQGHVIHVREVPPAEKEAFEYVLGYGEGIEIDARPLGDTFRKKVDAALAVLPELTCTALKRIVLYEPNELDTTTEGFYMMQASAADTIWLDRRNLERYVLDDDAMPQVVHTIAHEATHLVDALLLIEDGGYKPSQLVFGLEAEPEHVEGWKELYPRTRRLLWLHNARSLAQEWTRLHDSFVEAGHASDHGMAYFSLKDDAKISKLGFMSGYSATKPSDDIAEYAANALSFFGRAKDPPGPRTRGQWSACRRLNAYAEPLAQLPPELLVHYTKLRFLRGMEVLTEEAFRSCVGGRIADFFDELETGPHFFDQGEAGPTHRTPQQLGTSGGPHYLTGRERSGGANLGSWPSVELRFPAALTFGETRFSGTLALLLDTGDQPYFEEREDELRFAGLPRGHYELTYSQRSEITNDHFGFTGVEGEDKLGVEVAGNAFVLAAARGSFLAVLRISEWVRYTSCPAYLGGRMTAHCPESGPPTVILKTEYEVAGSPP